MKLSSLTGEILNRRTVYYVTVYGIERNILCFLSGPLSFVANRPDAALFNTKEEAEDLIKQAEANGLCAIIGGVSNMKVSSGVQYLTCQWCF